MKRGRINTVGSPAPSQVLEMNKRKKTCAFCSCGHMSQWSENVCECVFFPSFSQVVFVRLLRPVYKVSEGNLAWLVAPS